MRRREFISGLTAAAMWPLAARAQQPRTPVVGLLNGVAFEGPYASAIASIRRGLQETGLVEGQDFAIGASMPALADAASSTPIVFALGSDAVEVGVLNGLNRPEASMTGANFASAGPASERLALLLELRPGAPLVGYLDNSRLSATFEIN